MEISYTDIVLFNIVTILHGTTLTTYFNQVNKFQLIISSYIS